MSVVSPSQSNAGEEITAAKINNPVNQLAAVINGNIDANNIADSSITNVKVASGGLYTSKVYNPYKFSAYRNAAYNTAAAGITKMAYDAENFDTSANFDSTTNYRFTAPVAGFYHFSASLQLASPTARAFIMLYKNNAEYRRSTDVQTSTLNYSAHVSTLIQLGIGDYVEVFYFTDTAKAVVAGNVSGFDGYLVCAT